MTKTHGTHWPKAEDHDDEPDSTPVGEHTHRQPRVVLVGLTAAVVVLMIATGLTLIYGVSVNTRLGQVEDYIAGRGEVRDRENRELNERINRATCDVLDQLPAGELLDPVRREYGCGPGIPVAELTPEASQNLADILGQTEAPTVTADAPAVTTEPLPDELNPQPQPGAVIEPSVPVQPAPQPEAAPATPAPVPAPPIPAPASPAPPLVDLNPITDEVCALLGVCL